jgi:hypothetical protein
MIGMTSGPIFELFFFGLIVWVAIKAARYMRPLSSSFSWRSYRWTIANWFAVTFWIAVVLATVRALAMR